MKMKFCKKILVVDDEENVSALIKKVLIKEGFQVEAFNDPILALAYLENNYTDIIISDIRMPQMNGLDFLKKARELDNNIKMLLITAFATVDTAIDALRLGACDYITKPFNLEDIIQTVQKIASSVDKNDFEPEIAHLNLPGYNHLSSKSPVMQKLIQLVYQVADSKSTILINGETGTGKELLAQALHQLSSRKNQPFIRFNCAAIPETLLESELFGFEKGAFTGAVHKKPGRFELADKGTLFIDEIGDIPSSVQVKLLRTIQEKEFERLGGISTIKTDVRLITATNKDLDDLVTKGIFREDLYYRLNVINLNIPPLRCRREDIEDLCRFFLLKSSQISGKTPKTLHSEVLKFFMDYSWPGNIRELENVIERCALVSSGSVITLQDLPEKMLNRQIKPNETDLDSSIDKLEESIIRKALSENNGNKTLTAEKLGISRRSLHRKLNKFTID